MGVAAAVAASVLGAGVLGAVGIAGAGHGPEGSNFTDTPLSADDREPGASDTRVGQIGQAAVGVDTDFETLLRLRADPGPQLSQLPARQTARSRSRVSKSVSTPVAACPI